MWSWGILYHFSFNILEIKLLYLNLCFPTYHYISPELLVDSNDKRLSIILILFHNIEKLLLSFDNIFEVVVIIKYIFMIYH